MTATVEEQLVARLLAQPEVTALVGDRIEPVLNSQDTPLPALSYQTVGRATEHTHDGALTSRPRVQVTAIASTYAQVVAVLQACKLALDGVGWGNGCASFVENEFDGHNADSRTAGVYVRRMDVMVWDP